MKKRYIVVTGGGGFIGSNLIKYLILKTKFNIISIDDYSSGSVNNQIKHDRIKYFKANTLNIRSTLHKYKSIINSIFHFGEFSRIHQSFIDIKQCFSSNISGTSEVFSFCLENKIKIIYSATSASLGNFGKDKSLSPYALTKSANLQLLQHMRSWFGLSYECLYFYNVYGPGQIKEGPMSTIIGIFERQLEQNKFLTVTKPGTQSRKFTHIDDTIKGCFYAWKKNANRHYSLANNKSYTILSVAKMFGDKIKFIPKKYGEREKSTNPGKIENIKIHAYLCKIELKDYIKEFKNNLVI
jgi:UDP-glucose 4-epimerase